MGLIAHYPFNGNANDALGQSGLSFSLAGSWVAGKIGEGFDVAGTGGSATVVPSSIGLDLNSNRWGISGWVAPNRASWELNGDRHNFFEFGNYYTLGQTSILFGRHATDTTTKSFNFSIYQDQVGKAGPSPHSFTDAELDDWIFFAVHCDGKTLHANTYCAQSGRWQNTSRAVSWDTAAFPFADNIFIGGYGWAHSCWRGGIDDFRIYDDGISPRELRDLSLGLSGHWPLTSEIAGAIDASGNGLNGTLNNVTFMKDSGGNGYYFFSGSASDINLPNASNLKPSKNLSFFSEFYAEDTLSDRKTIMCVGRDVTSGYVAWVQNGSLTCYINGTNVGSFAVSPQTWHKFALLYESGIGGSLLLDGNVVATIPNLGDIQYSEMYGDSPTIGSHGGINYFKGGIKEVSAYIETLTVDQAIELQRQRASLDSHGNFLTREITEIGQAKPIVDYSVWEAGQTGGVIGFGTNGGTEKNSRVTDVGPHGNQIAVWQADNTDVDSTADGGWNGSNFPVDNTKRYRFSVWIRRKVIGNGSAYWGTHGYGSVNGVLNLSNLANNTNPYFWSGGVPDTDWFLVVGHVHPAGYTGAEHADTGRYKADGIKFGTAGDFVWLPETDSAHHRSYLYYSTDLTTQQQMAYPRVDVCDGTEPSIQQLIDGFDGRLIASDFQGKSLIDRHPSYSEVGVTRGMIVNLPLNGGPIDIANGTSLTAGHAGGYTALAGHVGANFTKVDSLMVAVNQPTDPDTWTMTCCVLLRDFTSYSSYPIFLSSSLPYFAVDALGENLRCSYQSGAQVNVASSASLTAGQWYAVTAVAKKGDGVRLYLEGQQVAHNPLDSTSAIGSLRIGAHGNPSYNINGLVRNVSVSNEPLTAIEVAQHHAFINPKGNDKAHMSATGLTIQGQFKEVVV